MKNIRNIKFALAGIALLIGATFATPAQAAVISVTPALQTVGLGDPATVNLDVTLAQGESTGGFALRLAFNPAILGTGVNVVFDPGGFLGVNLLTGVDSSVAGQVDIDATALVESLPNQGSGFTLATVTFLQTTGLGTSPVNIIDALGGLLSNADGTGLLETAVQGGCITVARSNTEPAQQCAQEVPVPEPGTMALMGLGVAGLAARLRRRVQA